MFKTDWAFDCEFSVEKHPTSQTPGRNSADCSASEVATREIHWSGQASIKEASDASGSVIGSSPRFELGAGWFTFHPPALPIVFLPARWFSDASRFEQDSKRRLVSYSVFIGEGLE